MILHHKIHQKTTLIYYIVYHVIGNNINGIQKVQIYKEMLKVTAQKNISLSELFSALSTHGYTIKNMSSETGSLETVFLELTGRNLRD